MIWNELGSLTTSILTGLFGVLWMWLCGYIDKYLGHDTSWDNLAKAGPPFIFAGFFMALGVLSKYLFVLGVVVLCFMIPAAIIATIVGFCKK